MRYGNCGHIRGEVYNNKLCHCILSDITDAYEWSFVAIPAQVNAGVTKGFGKSYADVQDIIKAVRNGTCVRLTKEQSAELGSYIATLEKQAEDGKVYRRNLIDEVVKFAVISMPEIDGDSIRRMCQPTDINELVKIRDAFRHKASEIIPLSPQLKAKKENTIKNNSDYKF